MLTAQHRVAPDSPTAAILSISKCLEALPGLSNLSPVGPQVNANRWAATRLSLLDVLV